MDKNSIYDFKDLDFPLLTTQTSFPKNSFRNIKDKMNKTKRIVNYDKPKIYFIPKSALELNPNNFITHGNSNIDKFNNSDNNKEKTKEKLGNAFSLQRVMEIINEKAALREKRTYLKAQNLIQLKKSIKDNINQYTIDQDKKMNATNKKDNTLNIDSHKKKRTLEVDQLLTSLNIKIKDKPFIDFHLTELNKIKSFCVHSSEDKTKAK